MFNSSLLSIFNSSFTVLVKFEYVLNSSFAVFVVMVLEFIFSFSVSLMRVQMFSFSVWLVLISTILVSVTTSSQLNLSISVPTSHFSGLIALFFAKGSNWGALAPPKALLNVPNVFGAFLKFGEKHAKYKV